MQFKSLGDGNCLYNTEAILLVYAYRQHLLTPLWHEPDFVKNIHALLKEINENNTVGISLTELGEGPSAQSTEAAFNQLISAMSVDDILDWGVVQEVMAPALRALVIKKIVDDAAVKEQIKTILTAAIRGIVDMSAPETLNLGIYFEGMTGISEKLSNVINDPAFRSLGQRERAMEKWFFEGLQEGFFAYLRGERGICNSGMNAEVVKKIVSNPAIREQIKIELISAIRTMVQISTPEKMVLGNYFDGMPEIREKLKSIITQPALKTPQQRQQAMEAWFFEEGEQGFLVYLNGEKGICNSGMNVEVIKQMLKNVVIMEHVKNELIAAIRAMVARSNPEFIELGSYFGNMTKIREKLRSIIIQPALTTPEQRQNAMLEWFFGEKEEGFTDFLYGNEGISKSGINASPLEMNVLSLLFHHSVKYHSAAHPENGFTVNGFVNPADIVELPPLEFQMQHVIARRSESSDHWNAILPDNELTKVIKTIYDHEQYPKAISRRDCRAKRETLRAALREPFGTFENHSKYLQLSKAEYCANYYLTENQYDQNSLPSLESMIKEAAWIAAHSKRPKRQNAVVKSPAKLKAPTDSPALSLISSAASAVSSAAFAASSAASAVSSVARPIVSSAAARIGNFLAPKAPVKTLAPSEKGAVSSAVAVAGPVITTSLKPKEVSAPSAAPAPVVVASPAPLAISPAPKPSVAPVQIVASPALVPASSAVPASPALVPEAARTVAKPQAKSQKESAKRSRNPEADLAFIPEQPELTQLFNNHKKAKVREEEGPSASVVSGEMQLVPSDSNSTKKKCMMMQ